MRICKFLINIVIFSLSILSAQAQNINVKHVLFISSYNPTFPTYPNQIEGLNSVFNTDKRIALDIECMDAKRFINDSINVQYFNRYLTYKLSKVPRYKVVIAGDDDAYNYVLSHQKDLFKGIPIVFLGVNNIDSIFKHKDNPCVTGVMENVAIGGTIELARSLFPKQHTLYAICDGTTTGQANLETFFDYVKNHSYIKYKLLDLQTMTFDRLFKTLHSIPVTDPILLIAAYTDINRTTLSFEESLYKIVHNSSAPLFHLWFPGIGDGILGGQVASHIDQGRIAGQLVMKILHGTPPYRLKVVSNNPNKYIFDFKQLKRFKIGKTLIPKGSVIINLPKSFYEENKSLIWSVLCIFLALMILIIFLAINILQRRKIAKALKKETLRAQESERVKSSILRNVNHEIRTPLNLIIGFTSLLNDNDTSAEERNRYNQIIQDNTSILLRLINDTLVLSRITSGQIELQNTRFDLNMMLGETMNYMRQRASSKGLEVICDFTRPISVFCDKELLEQVVSNLLTNAIKYTKEGIVELEYLYDNISLTIRVKDTGIGISEKNRNKIFKEFEKIDTFVQGMGLGLSLCKSIVSMMNGTIDFTSKENVGSTFWFTIPCQPEEIV
jgi:signal transduction histidine kinase